MSQRRGRFPTGTAIALAIALAALGAARARGDFFSVTPGPLADPHAPFDKQCDRCHVPYQGMPARSCLSCHARVEKQLQTKRGFHAALEGQKCSSCHHDHRGRAHALSPPVDAASFDHASTGFRLDGKHGKTACAACHPSRGPLGMKWAGIATACKACHGDPRHAGALGARCESCHSPTGWTPPLHPAAQHRIPIVGTHATLDCAACHAGGAHLVAKADCADCHERQHGGTAAPCASCHQPTGWKRATHEHTFCTCSLPGKHQTADCLKCHPGFRFTGTPFACAECHKKDLKHDDLGPCSRCHSALGWKRKAFDHDRGVPGFPITGRHTAVACESCHKAKTSTGMTQFKGASRACEGCHKTPRHGDFGGCAGCHTTAGFVPSKFSHDVTRFPLEGPHRAVGCATCHAKFRPLEFQPDGNSCALCHGDPHGNQFAPPAHGEAPRLPPPTARAHLAPESPAGAPPASTAGRTTCRDCHSAASFRPSTIGVAEHAAFRFPLRGRHGTVACAACHPAGAGGQRTRFADAPTRCADCHIDRHGGQFTRQAGGDCARCHVERGWNEVHGFDHGSAGMALEGAHAKLGCASCHGEDRKKLLALAKPVGCASCHVARHGRQFGADCASCHRATSFADVAAMSPQQHAQRSGFPLERRHAGLRCTQCHDPRRGERLSPACGGCHDDPHRGAAGTECRDCHLPDRWLLVRFDHDRSEFPLRGKHFVTPCGACHQNNQWFAVRTECVTCHAKDRPATMVHGKRWDCASCHTAFNWPMATM